MVPSLHPVQNEPTKNAMVPFLVPFHTGIMVPKVAQLFCSLFDRVDQLDLVKKNSQSVGQLLWGIPVC